MTPPMCVCVWRATYMSPLIKRMNQFIPDDSHFRISSVTSFISKSHTSPPLHFMRAVLAAVLPFKPSIHAGLIIIMIVHTHPAGPFAKHICAILKACSTARVQGTLLS